MLQVSIVLPAISPAPDFFRCVQAIRAAFSGVIAYEIICVIKDFGDFMNVEAVDTKLILEKQKGIYGAMNTGLEAAKGKYVYFIGQDDILLPSAAEAIQMGLVNMVDLIIADVYWGKDKIYKNSPSRHSLVWKNWCHQGLFFERSKFIQSIGNFPTAYTVQADHYANVVFSSQPNIRALKYNGCVAWYSSDGFSSRVLDSKFRMEFPDLVKRYYGAMAWLVVVVRRFALSLVKCGIGNK